MPKTRPRVIELAVLERDVSYKPLLLILARPLETRDTCKRGGLLTLRQDDPGSRRAFWRLRLRLACLTSPSFGMALLQETGDLVLVDLVSRHMARGI